MPQTLFDDFGDPKITAGKLSHGATSTPHESERPEYSYQQIPNSQHVVFDIETGPVWDSDSIDDAKAYCEPLGITYDPDSIGEHPGEFDRGSVRVGNLKDPAKIKAKYAEAAAKHRESVSLYEARKIGGEQSFWEGVIEKAPLSPVTGKALSIGSCRDGKIEIEFEEMLIIKNFWTTFCDCRSNSKSITGWNISGFDVPFLMIRSAVLGIEIPRGVMAKGKWLSDTFVDCMSLWGRGYNPWKQQNCNASAKDVARFLGCHRPGDEIEGKDFWRYFQGLEDVCHCGDLVQSHTQLSSCTTPRAMLDGRDLAIRYLQNDVAEEAIIARALGVI